MKSLLLILLMCFCFSCNSGNGAYNKYGQRAEVSQEDEFNTNEKSVRLNGNRKVAAEKIEGVPPQNTFNNAQAVTMSELSISPYKYIGALILLTGQVYKIEQLPQTNNYQGSWYSILMRVENPNSSFGTVTVEFDYQADNLDINPQTYIIVAGYFCGTQEGQNAVGGTVTGYLLTGNYAKETEQQQ